MLWHLLHKFVLAACQSCRVIIYCSVAAIITSSWITASSITPPTAFSKYIYICVRGPPIYTRVHELK